MYHHIVGSSILVGLRLQQHKHHESKNLIRYQIFVKLIYLKLTVADIARRHTDKLNDEHNLDDEHSATHLELQPFCNGTCQHCA